jgi:hypothetical protein
MNDGPIWTHGTTPSNVFQQQQKNDYDAAQAAAKSAQRRREAEAADAAAASKKRQDEAYQERIAQIRNGASFRASSSLSFDGPSAEPIRFRNRIRTLLSAAFLLFIWWLGFSSPWPPPHHPYDYFLWSWGIQYSNPYGNTLAGYPYDYYIMWGSLALGFVQFLRVFRSSRRY